MMTTERLAELEALERAATPGPWFHAEDDAEDCPDHANSGLALVDTGRQSDYTIARLMEWNNAPFIAAARTAIPELIAALREAQKQRQTDLKSIGWLAERESLLDEWWTKAVDERDALQARVKALEAAGEKLARQHHDTCSNALIDGYECDCGKGQWDRAVKGESQ